MSEIREPCDELITFMNAYPDHVKKMALQLREKVLSEATGSFELIYDSYNALSTAFSLTDNLNEAFCHIALYSKHVNLGFNHGIDLADPEGYLQGSGKHIRHLKIKDPEDIKAPHIPEFIKKAIDHINQKFPDAGPPSESKAVVKSISENKRRPT